MVESPSSQRTLLLGNNHSGSSTPKLSNEFTWCYENLSPISLNNGTSFDQCLPKLEIDDKPLLYRQQFELTVQNYNFFNLVLNKFNFFFLRNILIGME